MNTALKAVSLASLGASVLGHGRWACPLPRDYLDSSGNVIGFDNTVLDFSITYRKES